MTTDTTNCAAPDPFELARRQGRAEAIAEVAEWLETCVGRVGLWHRAEIAADLRDGSWRAQTPLKGLRRRDLLERRARALLSRRVPPVEWPDELREFAASYRAARVADRSASEARVARILREEYGLAAP